jgi:hypothetical protein
MIEEQVIRYLWTALDGAKYVGWGVLIAYALWVYYLAVMSLRRAKAAGTINPGAFQTFALVLVVVPGVALDWLANFTVATVIFLEFPKSWGELVTGRLKRHCGLLTWRGVLAKFVCTELLDRFDLTGKHC